VDEFFPDPALVADPAGPGDDQGVGHATQVGVLFVEAERRVRDTGPGHRVVGEGRVLAHHIIEFSGLLDRYRPTERRGEDIGRALGGSFAGSSVVRHDQHQGVVGLTEVAQRLHQPPDIAVHISDHGGIDLHVAGKDPPLDGVQLGPGPGAEGQGRQAGRRRRQTHCLLPLQPGRTHRIPADVVMPLVGVALASPCLQRGMGTREGQLEMEGLVRRQRLLRADIADRPVGQIVTDIVVVRDGCFDRCHAVVQGRGFEIVG